MPRTAARRDAVASRLADVERLDPEWRPWLRLLAAVRVQLDDAGWDRAVTLTTDQRRGEPAPDAPLLEGCVLAVDALRARRLLRSLARTAGVSGTSETATLSRYRPAPSEALGILEAAIRQDRSRLAAAAPEGVDPAALATVALLAAVPVLQAARRRLAVRMPPNWPHGWCPLCAAWPTLVEVRGLDRSRWLRCVRCGSGWQWSWLRCTYCSEGRHQRLGSVVMEGAPEGYRAETCASCRGYLKSVTTLQPLSPFGLFLADLETVELDLVAVERGLSRPAGPGYVLDLQISPRRSRSILPFA